MAELNQYQEATVNTATAMELVLIVYDECLRSLSVAETAFDITGPQRIEQVGSALSQAQNGITELMLSLDMDQGGEIATNLKRLYDFMLHHLSLANVKKELQPILDVKELLLELREAWVTVAEQESMILADQTPVSAGRSGGRLNIAG